MLLIFTAEISRLLIPCKARPYLKCGAEIMIYNDFPICHGSKELLGFSSTRGAITALTWSGSENMINEDI